VEFRVAPAAARQEELLRASGPKSPERFALPGLIGRESAVLRSGPAAGITIRPNRTEMNGKDGLAMLFSSIADPVPMLFAYLDPGTGSLMLQILIAGLFSGMFFLKSSIATIRGSLGRLLK
jgi:hypothetical protein